VLTLPVKAQTVAEDQTTYLDFTGANAIILTDADPGDVLTLTLSVAHGTLVVKTDVPSGITSASGNGTSTVVISGTAAQLAATLGSGPPVRYACVLIYGSAGGAGAEALNFAWTDGVAGHDQGGSVAISVTAVNDAPTFDGAVGVMVQEGGSVTFSRAQLAS